MILTKPQAEAIYSALRMLDTLNAVTQIRLDSSVSDQFLWVKRYMDGAISVWYVNRIGEPVRGGSSGNYSNLNAFGLAYCVGV